MRDEPLVGEAAALTSVAPWHRYMRVKAPRMSAAVGSVAPYLRS